MVHIYAIFFGVSTIILNQFDYSLTTDNSSLSISPIYDF